MSLLVLSLLFFSLCSSVYLLFRVHALQLQVCIPFQNTRSSVVRRYQKQIAYHSINFVNLPQLSQLLIPIQVESRRDKYDPSYYSDDLASLLDTESSERMRKILSNNVGQISQVRYLLTMDPM